MGFEEIWNEYTSSEKDMFQKSVRRLLKQTFIVRDRDEDSKKAYYFVSKRSEPFSAYLGYIGYDIVIDRENGVIMLQNCRDLGENGKLQINHVTLKKMESVVLCCLWTLYADRVRSGNLSKNIEISVTDLRYEMEKYGIRRDDVYNYARYNSIRKMHHGKSMFLLKEDFDKVMAEKSGI